MVEEYRRWEESVGKGVGEGSNEVGYGSGAEERGE